MDSSNTSCASTLVQPKHSLISGIILLHIKNVYFDLALSTSQHIGKYKTDSRYQRAQKIRISKNIGSSVLLPLAKINCFSEKTFFLRFLIAEAKSTVSLLRLTVDRECRRQHQRIWWKHNRCPIKDLLTTWRFSDLLTAFWRYLTEPFKIATLKPPNSWEMTTRKWADETALSSWYIIKFIIALAPAETIHTLYRD